MPVGVSRTTTPAAVPDIGRAPAGSNPTIVQPLGSGSPAGALISIAATPNAAAVGDLVVVAFGWATSSTAISTVSDTSSNSWTIVQTPAPAQETGGYAYTIVTTGWASGANTVTATLASGAPGGRVWAAAKIAAAYSPVVDQHVESSATGDATVATGTLAQAAESVIAVAIDRAVTSAAVAPTFPWSLNFVGVAQATGAGTTNSGVSIAAYDNLSGVTGPVTAKVASTLSGDQVGVGVLAVQVSTSVATVTPPRPVVQDQAAFARQPLNRSHQSRVLQPPVQAAAAAAQTAVTFDNATQGSGLTFNHTTSGLNRYLIVGVSIWNGTSISVSGITYAGTAMTPLNRSVGSINTSELWGLINPALGSNTVAITLSGATGSVQAGAVSFTNANQVTQNGSAAGSSGSGSSPTSAALTGPPGGMLVDMVDDGTAVTVSTGTQAWNDGGGDAQAYLQTTGVPQSTSWTTGVTPPWAMSAGIVLPAGPIVTPLQPQSVVHTSPVPRDAQTRRASNVYVGGRQQLAATTTAPTVTPPPRVVVQSLVASGEQRRRVHGSVIAPVVQATAAPTQPNPRQVTIQAAQLAARRARHGGVVQSRWPGYEWAGLAPVTPTPRQVVQDAAAVWQARQDHRRGLIVALPVQLAAATAGAAPVTPPLPKQVVVARAAFQARRQQHGGRVAEPGVQLAAAVAPPPPTVTPPRTVFIVQAAQQPRQHRRGVVTAPRPVQGVTTRPIVMVVTARPPSVQSRRHGCVTAPRRITAPIAPPRPVVVHPMPQRRRRGGSVTALHGRFVQTGGPSTLITTPLTGLVAAGDRGSVAAGDTAQPPAGDTGTVKAGNTGFPQI